MIVVPEAKNRTIVSSFFWTKHRNLTEGQTDRNLLAITFLALRALRMRCKMKKISLVIKDLVYETKAKARPQGQHD